jgi:hypothetical protein
MMKYVFMGIVIGISLAKIVSPVTVLRDDGTLCAKIK